MSVFAYSVSGFGINLHIFCMHYYIPNDQILLCFKSEQSQLPLKLEPLGSISHTERDVGHPKYKLEPLGSLAIQSATWHTPNIN